jgi:L-asparaginase
MMAVIRRMAGIINRTTCVLNRSVSYNLNSEISFGNVGLSGSALEESRVLIINTGVTAGMDRLPNGMLSPVPGYLSEQIRDTLKITKGLPACDVVEWDELLDSSDIGPNHWAKMALQVEEHYLNYDGFVIVHGTDTLAYTSSALSFMLQNLGKPVILTGGMIPFCDPLNDCRRNILSSILTAGAIDLPEVALFFNTCLFRGNRAIKQSTFQVNAFHSPNFPRLGRLSTGMHIRNELTLRQPRGPLKVHTSLNTSVSVLRLVPGFDDAHIELLVDSHQRGDKAALILMLYGSGGAPAKKERMYAALTSAVERGMVVAVTSQCPHGHADLGQYEVSASLSRTGVLSGGDMTVEAASAKIAYLMGRDGLSLAELKGAFNVDLRGERTSLQIPPHLYNTVQML